MYFLRVMTAVKQTGNISKNAFPLLDDSVGFVDDVVLPGPKMTLSQGQTALRSAGQSYKSSTRLGHALSKHAGRKPGLWGKIKGNPKTWHQQGMKQFREIYDAPGGFKKVTTDGISFLEKRLPDGRGIRLQMDYTFKGFID